MVEKVMEIGEETYFIIGNVNEQYCSLEVRYTVTLKALYK